MNGRFEKDGVIATLTLDRPDRLNAMAFKKVGVVPDGGAIFFLT